MQNDLIETLLGIEPGSPLFLLRAERPDIRRHIQGAFMALVLPGIPGSVSLNERAAIATQAARLEGDAELAAEYGLLANPSDLDRLGLLLPYAEMVAIRPGDVTQATIDDLVTAGLSPQNIVAVTQLAAFVPFQTRLLAGLRAMLDTTPATPAAIPDPPARLTPGHFTPGHFTMDVVGWTPRVPPVESQTATPEQLAALDACPPAVKGSVYFRTLALDPASLAERGALFDRVMYAPRGLPRAERELATAVVSMVNGCVYCTSVHARRFAELTRDPSAMQRLLDQGFATRLEPRARAIVDFAAKLTAVPTQVTRSDLEPLRTAGLVPLELLDLVHAIAMFANANRLMQSLGESTPP
jgi:uncharacterized peroxidase-related enzyme